MSKLSVPSSRAIQRLISTKSHLCVPVAAASPVSSGKQAIKHVRGRRVRDDLRQVLAAHEEHMVDAKISRHGLVTGLPLTTAPLDHDWAALAQTLGRMQERQAIRPGTVEGLVEASAMVQLTEQFPELRRNAHQFSRPGRQSSGQIGETKSPERGRELGDRCPVVCQRGSPSVAEDRRHAKLERRDGNRDATNTSRNGCFTKAHCSLPVGVCRQSLQIVPVKQSDHICDGLVLT